MKKVLFHQEGFAFVIVLLILALIVTMVVEFSYNIYTSTVNLNNWIDSQRLFFMGTSGINIAVKYIKDWVNTQTYTPGSVDMPVEVEKDYKDIHGFISINVVDESSKFNVNTIINKRGEVDVKNFGKFKRLLKALSLKEEIADRILDWIDADRIETVVDSERDSKNLPFDSVDEILLIEGINREDYNRLKPYLTVYGDGRININGAEIAVLKSLSDDITDDIAKRIVDYRKNMPFEETGDIFKVNGLQTTGQSIIGDIRVKGEYFSLHTETGYNGIKKIIDTVICIKGPFAVTLYWKEY